MPADERKKRIAELIKQGPKPGCIGVILQHDGERMDEVWPYDSGTPIETLLENVSRFINNTCRQSVYDGAKVVVFDHLLPPPASYD